VTIGNSADIATSWSDTVATVRTRPTPNCFASPRLNRTGKASPLADKRKGVPEANKKDHWAQSTLLPPAPG